MLLCDVAKKKKKKKGDEKQKTAHVESLQKVLDRLVTERATRACVRKRCSLGFHG